MAEKKALAPGYYIGVFQQPINFRLDEPKIADAQGFEGTFDDLFEEYRTPNSRKANGRKPAASETARTEPGTITTQSSGWLPVSNPSTTRTKAIAAPAIYKASGGADPAQADELVARFKKYAAQQLAANVGKVDDEVRAVIRDINRNACYVIEVRVKLLRVDTKPFEGGRQNGDRYFGEVLLRKFYISQVMVISLVGALAEAIADDGLTMNGVNQLVIAKRDGTPDKRFGGPQFSIRGSSSYDGEMRKVLDYLRSRNFDAKT